MFLLIISFISLLVFVIGTTKMLTSDNKNWRIVTLITFVFFSICLFIRTDVINKNNKILKKEVAAHFNTSSKNILIKDLPDKQGIFSFNIENQNYRNVYYENMVYLLEVKNEKNIKSITKVKN